MEVENWEIPIGTEVEIINKDSRFFSRKGTKGANDDWGIGCNIWFEDGTFDCFCWDEFLPVQTN